MAYVSRILRVVIGILIVALVFSVALGVFYRYAMQQSLYWATEVPNFLLVWIVFLGSVVAFHENQHIAFRVLVESLGEKVRRVAEVLVSLIVLTFLGMLIYYGVNLVAQTMDSPSEALKIPQGYLYACLPLSMALMAVSAIQNLVATLRGTGR